MNTRKTVAILAAMSAVACVKGQAGGERIGGPLPETLEVGVDSLVLTVGDTATIEAMAFSSGHQPYPTNLGWSSGNSNIATVTDVMDDGLVQGISAGLTTVQVEVLGAAIPPVVIPVRVN